MDRSTTFLPEKVKKLDQKPLIDSQKTWIVVKAIN